MGDKKEVEKTLIRIQRRLYLLEKHFMVNADGGREEKLDRRLIKRFLNVSAIGCL